MLPAAYKSLIDQLLVFLTIGASMTKADWDDSVVKFVKMFWDTDAFKAWFDSVPPAQLNAGTLVVSQSLQEPGPEMEQLFERFKGQVGEEGAGKLSRLISLLFEAISLWKAFQGMIPAAQTPAG